MNMRAVRKTMAEFAELKARLRAERLADMSCFVTQFAEVHARVHPPPVRRPLPERLANMGEAVQAFRVLQEQLRLGRPADFSILSVLHRENDELTHSRLVAWLLDPRGDHNQGPLFLSALASLIGLEAAPVSLHRCVVRTEVAGPEAIIDVMLVWWDDFLVFVENKVWSPEGEAQVDREFRDLRYAGQAMGIAVDRQFAVFLTPSGRRPISGDPGPWVCLSYQDLAAAFRAVLPDVTDDKVRMVVNDWLSVISDWG